MSLRGRGSSTDRGHSCSLCCLWPLASVASTPPSLDVGPSSVGYKDLLSPSPSKTHISSIWKRAGGGLCWLSFFLGRCADSLMLSHRAVPDHPSLACFLGHPLSLTPISLHLSPFLAALWPSPERTDCEAKVRAHGFVGAYPYGGQRLTSVSLIEPGVFQFCRLAGRLSLPP